MASPTSPLAPQVGILVFEDDAGSSAALRQILDSEGWRVRVVPDVPLLQAELKTAEYSLLIANAILVGGNPALFHVLRELASVSVDDGGKLRVLYVVPEMSGNQIIAQLEEAKLPYVVRPFHLHDFLEKVSDLGSAHRMQRVSPTFALLARELDRHIARFARELQFALGAHALVMTDCWVNIMGRGAVHGAHLHPHSTISGVYYVAVPPGAPGLKLEDPRLACFMAAPPRARAAQRRNRAWVTIRAHSGQLVLFESWLRHEVAANRDARERVSISFNYNWF